MYKSDCVAHTDWYCSGFNSVDMSADGKKVVAVGPHGIAQSLDGGLTWNKKNRVCLILNQKESIPLTPLMVTLYM